jgi:hypothetical protein
LGLQLLRPQRPLEFDVADLHTTLQLDELNVVCAGTIEQLRAKFGDARGDK